MRTKLLEEKTQFEKELAGFTEHTEVGDEPDENATEVHMDLVNQNNINRIEGELKKIDQALAKIDDGTYGQDKDGNQISEDRLRVMPWADTAL